MDPIADMLTIIRNAILIDKHEISVPLSKVKFHIIRAFEDLGLVADIKKDDKAAKLTFNIVAEDNKPLFTKIKRLSTPGRRVYVGWKDIPHPSGNGAIIVSTSQGVMTGKTARQRHLGGELICEIS